jgi:hypothetical protein
MENTEKLWTEPDETGLTTAQRCVYRIRKKAVVLYKKGHGAKEIFLATGMNSVEVLRLWNRCCAMDPETGECYGFKALVPRSKIKKFIR